MDSRCKCIETITSNLADPQGFPLSRSPSLTKYRGLRERDCTITCTSAEVVFCQGRNTAVRFPRFDSPVFSDGNVCPLGKIFFIVGCRKNKQLIRLIQCTLTIKLAPRHGYENRSKLFKTSQTGYDNKAWLSLPTRWRKLNVLCLWQKRKSFKVNEVYVVLLPKKAETFLPYYSLALFKFLQIQVGTDEKDLNPISDCYLAMLVPFRHKETNLDENARMVAIETDSASRNLKGSDGC